MPPARVADESRDILGDQQTIRALRDLRGSGDDLLRVSDRVYFDDVIYIVSLDLPGNAWKGDEIIRDDDHMLGVYGVGEGESKRTACGRTM